MQANDFGLSHEEQASEKTPPSGKFLQQDAQKTLYGDGWNPEDKVTVRRAIKTAGTFLRSHHEEKYYPSYEAQSDEIFDTLKQIKDKMTMDT